MKNSIILENFMIIDKLEMRTEMKRKKNCRERERTFFLSNMLVTCAL